MPHRQSHLHFGCQGDARALHAQRTANPIHDERFEIRPCFEREHMTEQRQAEIGILDSSMPMSEPDSHIQDNCAFVPEMPWAYQMRSRRPAAYSRA